MAASGGKQYGLIIPQKSASKSTTLLRPSVFGDDSDDETSVGESLQKEAIKKKMMKQTRLEMQKALDEDSSVYEYDNVYDDIQKQRLESNKKLLGGTDRKPKYIQQLMRAVEDRKKEQERRDERKIQKEREAEGDKFADKEAYVTSAYRQKLKERQEELEREKRAAELEAALDVKKQKDLSGFYRHLLNQTVGEEAVPDRSADRQEKSKVQNSPPAGTNSDAESHSDEEKGMSKAEFSKSGTNSGHSKRHYRRRSCSSSSGDERDKYKKQEEKRSHKERDVCRSKDKERKGEHGHRKEDRDHTRDRDRHRDRESEKWRERKDREKERDVEDRHGRKSKADSERERPREKEPKTEDEEKRKENEKDKRNKDEKEKEKTEAENSDKAEENAPSKFAKRSSEQTVSSARERYLARQMARTTAKSYIEKDDE